MDSGSPFWHYFSTFDAIEVLNRHARRDIVPESQFLKNFLGARIRPSYMPDILMGREGLVEPVPLPANWHADIAEWAAALRSVDLSGKRFLVVELGCGWGTWIVNTGLAAKVLGKDVHLIGIEGDERHVEFANDACAINNFQKDEFEIIRGIASADAGQGLFPKSSNGEANWGKSEIKADQQMFSAKSFDKLEKIRLIDVVPPDRWVDLLHIDIQGSEYEFIANGMSYLKEKVRYILIGTHSRKIEGDLFVIMSENCWDLEIERPAIYQNIAGQPILSVDGVQGWCNQKLR